MHICQNKGLVNSIGTGCCSVGRGCTYSLSDAGMGILPAHFKYQSELAFLNLCKWGKKSCESFCFLNVSYSELEDWQQFVTEAESSSGYLEANTCTNQYNLHFASLLGISSACFDGGQPGSHHYLGVNQILIYIKVSAPQWLQITKYLISSFTIWT